MTPIVSFQDVSKWYGNVIGINKVSVQIGSGVTGLLGPNGAGKSTLLQLATGQLRPSQGTVRVLGRAIWNNASLNRAIGLCPEQDAFYEWMTGWDFVFTCARLCGLAGQVARAAAERTIDAVGMTQHQGRPIRGYSKGMRQRIKLAQALVHDPEVLFLDEPLSGTDPVARRDLIDIIIRLGNEGRTVLVSSHVLYEVQALTPNIVLLNRGRLVAEGHVRQIRDLIDKHPHHIKLVCREYRRLAARIMAWEDVEGVSVFPQENALMVETRAPDAFYGRLPSLSLENGLAIQSVYSDDDNLEAVFPVFGEFMTTIPALSNHVPDRMAEVPRDAARGISRLGICRALYRLTLRQHLHGKRWVALIFLFLIPASLAILIRTTGPGVPGLFLEFLLGWILVPQALLPLVALLYASGIIQDEQEEQTITYLLVRPIPKWLMYTVKLAATWTTTVVLVMALTILTHVAIYARSDAVLSNVIHRCFWSCLILSLAVVAYCSLFGLMSLLTKRILVAGVLYTAIVEGFFATLPMSLRLGTIIYYTRLIAYRTLDFVVTWPGGREDDVAATAWLLDTQSDPGLAEHPQLWTCVWVLLSASVVCTVISGWLCSRREFHVKTPEQE